MLWYIKSLSFVEVCFNKPTCTLKEYSNLTRKGKETACSILFSFSVCSICFNFTTWKKRQEKVLRLYLDERAMPDLKSKRINVQAKLWALHFFSPTSVNTGFCWFSSVCCMGEGAISLKCPPICPFIWRNWWVGVNFGQTLRESQVLNDFAFTGGSES